MLKDNFLNENEHLIFHIPTYQKFISEAFDCKYEFLSVSDNNYKLILPLVEIKSKLFGNKIISSAYLEYGGFVGNKEKVNELISELEQKYSQNFDYLEIRGGLNESYLDNTKIIKKNYYKRFVLELSSENDVWQNIQKSKRKAIKKSLKNVEVKEVSFADLKEFYKLYLRNMRSFGSPPYSFKYFVSFYKNIVINNFGKIYGSYYNGKLVAALLGFTYQDRVHILIAVSNPRYQQFRPNDAVHWTFIKWAIENKFKFFDFGRVREESGQFEYKRKWGPKLLSLPSYFLLWQGKEIPLIDPSSAKYKLLLKVWKLMPLWFTRLVGMWLRKGLGI